MRQYAEVDKMIGTYGSVDNVPKDVLRALVMGETLLYQNVDGNIRATVAIDCAVTGKDCQIELAELEKAKLNPANREALAQAFLTFVNCGVDYNPKLLQRVFAENTELFKTLDKDFDLSVLTRNGIRLHGWTTDYDDAYQKTYGHPPGTIQRLFSMYRMPAAILETLPVVAVPGDVWNGPAVDKDGYGYAIGTDSRGEPKFLYRNAISGKYYDPTSIETQLELIGLMPTAGIMFGPTGEAVLVSGGKSIFGRDLAGSFLSKEATGVLTEAEARVLAGENRGLIFVRETPRGGAAAQAFESGTEGAMMDLATQQRIVPAIRYDNPSGLNYIKLDALPQPLTMNAAGELTLIDAKNKLLIWDEATQTKTLNTLERLESALAQNPGMKVVYEFPNNSTKAAADFFFKEKNLEGIVTTRVRQK